MLSKLHTRKNDSLVVIHFFAPSTIVPRPPLYPVECWAEIGSFVRNAGREIGACVLGLQKLAFRLVSSRAPIVDLTEFAAVLGTAAAAAHFHARNAHIHGFLDDVRGVCLERPASAERIPAVRGIQIAKGLVPYVVSRQESIQTKGIEVFA